jgi:hypothetical protein
MFGPKTFMVFWFQGDKLGTLIENKINQREAESLWEMEFLKRDEEGNAHYSVRAKMTNNVSQDTGSTAMFKK